MRFYIVIFPIRQLQLQRLIGLVPVVVVHLQRNVRAGHSRLHLHHAAPFRDFHNPVVMVMTVCLSGTVDRRRRVFKMQVFHRQQLRRRRIDRDLHAVCFPMLVNPGLVLDEGNHWDGRRRIVVVVHRYRCRRIRVVGRIPRAGSHRRRDAAIRLVHFVICRGYVEGGPAGRVYCHHPGSGAAGGEASAVRHRHRHRNGTRRCRIRRQREGRRVSLFHRGRTGRNRYHWGVGRGIIVVPDGQRVDVRASHSVARAARQRQHQRLIGLVLRVVYDCHREIYARLTRRHGHGQA